MPLSTFHPAVQKWFSSRFESPSPPQAQGWPLIRDGRDTLICAPTGSGKTLSAFMACLDSLFKQVAAGTLEEMTQVVYVSPLKALSNDIQKNLREPLDGIYGVAHEMGIIAPEIRVLVRTGDTPMKERQAMLRRPPHILVTTPESLFILLTARKSREFLRGVRHVIVDEIHAVARDKRGAHLALTLERLDALCVKRPQRIGLSATQRPIEKVAQFLVGQQEIDTGVLHAGETRPCAIVNQGHLRKIELEIEIPGSPLEHVCSHETWEEIYERLTALILANRTTLIFVNTRRLCERLAAHLSKRIGDDKVASHHGSLSRAHRLNAELRLKSGDLRALVATASLELGIDIGNVDLVCQIGPVNAIGTLLQRAGRSGHTLKGTSRARVFALTLDELMSCSALASAIRRGYLDTLQIPDQPRDILAQQIVAASAADEWGEDDLFALVRRAYNYRNLNRADFDAIVQMLAEGFTPRRGRNSALISYDGVGKRIRGRRGARLASITSGGAIPDTADYQVVLEPEGLVVGTLNEDFAVESTPGDIFQLGNTSWKILKVEPGRVRVQDAKGQPPSIPFWLGEAPPRSDELSAEITRLRKGIEEKLLNGGIDAAIQWLSDESGISAPLARQLCEHLASGMRSLGVLPTTQTLVLERFFDDSGGMQLILHAPFGRRINWGWGLALRKRFCRGFNFELQAAASENAILLSLGPQHSFPLADVFHYLNPKTVEELLLQAALEAPVFQTRWRWDACRALALLRFSGGKKVPAALMRMRSDDLLALVFPHAAACPENLEGDREVPDHPLVREVVHDCLHEAMDIDGLVSVLENIQQGKLRLIARDTTEPSALAGEILTAKPYAFLDDAPLEERRTQAVSMRRGLSREDAATLGALDPAAIERVRNEAWPEPQNADELHDALMMLGYLTDNEAQAFAPLPADLLAAGRATRSLNMLLATERVPLFEAVYAASAVFQPAVEVPARERSAVWTREKALAEIVRGRLESLGPVTAARLTTEMSLPESDIDQALLALETQGSAMRGVFSTEAHANKGVEWCDRRLLARIHRYTLDRLRREIEPASAAEYMRFLFSWHHVENPAAGEHPAGTLHRSAFSPDHNAAGPRALSDAVSQLQGLELPALAWERDVLPARVPAYNRSWLDQLALSGELAWGRRSPPPVPSEPKRHSAQVRHAPIGLYLREQIESWLTFAPPLALDEAHLSGAAKQVLELLRRRSAVFYQNLVRETQRLPAEVESALGELVACGLVTADGFAGLRALLGRPSSARKMERRRRFRVLRTAGEHAAIQSAGRWSLFRGDAQPDLFGKPGAEEAVEKIARQLLRRWGVVFHRVLVRETGLPPWRDILRVYRRMEARGELRGGRFVQGFSGEQYALPEAVEHLRLIRKRPAEGRLLTISGADPLNLAGIVTPGDRIAARAKTRIVYRDGVPVALKEAGEVRILQHEVSASFTREIYAALMRKAM